VCIPLFALPAGLLQRVVYLLLGQLHDGTLRPGYDHGLPPHLEERTAAAKPLAEPGWKGA
jgi:hypothetical protein